MNGLSRLKETCVFIRGPDGSGTGYLVAPQRIGTALHVVRSWQKGQFFPVMIGVNGQMRQAYLIKSDSATDSAVLGFDEPIDVVPLPVAQPLAVNCEWAGYGFPASAVKTANPHGLPIDGRVMDPQTTNDVGQTAILLYSHEIAAGNASPLHGFSGSPVLVDGALAGHLTKHIGDADDKRRAAYGYVYACPISEVIKLLDVELETVTIEPTAITTREQSIPSIGADEFHVFVSYRSTDRPWAMRLVTRLEGAGLRVFIDQNELKPGGYLAGQLQSALARSRAAVLLVSQGWIESPWCQEEANVLIQRDVSDKRFMLVPLRIDKSTMPPMLNARVWLDFSDMAEPGGGALDRLLNALIDIVPGERSEPSERADETDLRVTDRFVAEIRTAGKGDVSGVWTTVSEWRATGLTDVAPLIAAAEVFSGKGWFESTLDVLADMPPSVRVRQLRAFAFRKLGQIDKAIRKLEAFKEEGQLDAETAGLLAGCYKARWQQADDHNFAQLAYLTYREAYELYDDPFNGINTAAMALHCNERNVMIAVATQVRDKLLKKREADRDHWDLATLGEASLLLSRFDDARDWYRKAAARAAGLPENIAVMRRQARLNLGALGEPKEKFDDLLRVPRVLVYFGHMVDAPGRPIPRFPASKVGALVNAVRSKIQSYGLLCGYGQAARGTDLIVLQVLLDRGSPAEVVLPMPMEDFFALSVGEKWKDRFEVVRRSACVHFAEPVRKRRPTNEELEQAFAEANREVMRRATEFARRLDSTPIVLAVWDGREGDGPGGTADAVELWQQAGYDVDLIDIDKV
ncbi:TIR domain-containing protein [Paraburkholderia sp. BR10879]|uniref:TIR domain-containing protein n=1 Tax=Paraburkholderia sp. BR10882 TaxID=3236991 RepID=UPI0034CDE044